MSMFNALDIARSGTILSRQWMDAIADNVANVNTVRPFEEEAYRARRVMARSVQDADGTPRGVELQSYVLDEREGQYMFDQNSPFSNEEGLVKRPSVELGEEMSDLVIASRSYEANLSVIDRVRDTYMAALRIGQQ